MDIRYPCCCGLDIRKRTVTAYLIDSDLKGRSREEVRTFGTMTDELLALADWLAGASCTHVAMESTGVYWKPIDNLLEATFTLLLVNMLMQMQTGFWPWLFVAAALFNFVIGVPIMLAPRWTYRLAYRPPLVNDEEMAIKFWGDFGFAVTLIGAGYYLVSRDVTQNRGLVWLGIFAKVFDVVALASRFATGVAKPVVIVPAGIDGGSCCYSHSSCGELVTGLANKAYYPDMVGLQRGATAACGDRFGARYTGPVRYRDANG